MLEVLLSEHCSRCVYLDGSNAENKISLLVILCIIMYVKKIIIIKIAFFFFFLPIMVKCLNIGKNIGQQIYQSISNLKCIFHFFFGPTILGLAQFFLFNTKSKLLRFTFVLLICDDHCMLFQRQVKVFSISAKLWSNFWHYVTDLLGYLLTFERTTACLYGVCQFWAKMM